MLTRIRILSNLCMHIKDIFVERLGRQISTLYHESISPEVIFLHPPEKLVIEVRCRGRYNGISWEDQVDPLIGHYFQIMMKFMHLEEPQKLIMVCIK